MKKNQYKTAAATGLFCLFFGGTSAQNIGIGTNSPSALLEVAGGDARINGLTIGRGKNGIESNVAAGDSSLFNNIIGNSNTAIGLKTLFNNKEGSYNVAVGRQALYNNTIGIDNIAVGTLALGANDSGSVNTALGDWSLKHNTKGNYNTGLGGRALFTNISGVGNTAAGLSSLYKTESGNYNTGLGYNAGSENIGGNSNTLIGAFADVTTSNLTNAGAIGYNATVSASNSFVIGSAGTNTGIGISAPAEKLDVNGAIKISNGSYTAISDNATTPVPAGGAGTIIFIQEHFYGWNGSAWKQLDN